MNLSLVSNDPKLELRFVAPSSLHLFWEQCEPLIIECLAHETDNVWKEDIYAAIKAGSAQLFIGVVNEHFVGMTVLQRWQCQYSGDQVLHIWMVNGSNFMETGMPLIEKMAKDAGVAKIRFRASREAYGRLTQKLGFRRTQIEYEKVL